MELPEYTQRWREQECRWVPRRALVDPKKIEVAQVDEATAKAFVIEHHYSKSYPAARFRFGVYECGRLSGMMVLSEPANVRVIPAWTDYTRAQGVELGRLVLLDELGYNAESLVLSKMRRQLRELAPELRCILAYSDPVPRTRRDGEVVFLGHRGQVYQATSASYLGHASSRTHYLDDDGRTISGRLLSKIRNAESGHAYARTRLEQASQTVQRCDETNAAWVKRALASCRKLRHTGNHVYVWGLTSRDRVPASRPYPKHFDPRQLQLL